MFKKKTEVKETKKPTVKKETKKPVAKKVTAKIKYPDVAYGEKGEIITQLQDLLTRDGSKVKIDGVFGIGTQSAVRAFQKRHELKITGKVDQKTWAELLKVIKKK